MEKVVKCDNEQCGLYFGYSEKKTKCPFCHTPHNTVEEKDKPPHLDISGGGKDKKVTAKTPKESFKVWKNPHTN